MRNTICVGLLAVILASALGTALAAGSEEEQRLRDLDKQWSDAAASKDAARTAAFYAADGSMLPF